MRYPYRMGITLIFKQSRTLSYENHATLHFEGDFLRQARYVKKQAQFLVP